MPEPIRLFNTLSRQVEELKPIGRMEYVGDAGPIDLSSLYRYRFPPQKHRFDPAAQRCRESSPCTTST